MKMHTRVHINYFIFLLIIKTYFKVIEIKYYLLKDRIQERAMNNDNR